MIRSLDHNNEQIVWAEQTEIELENFLREFDNLVWPVFQRRGYNKNAALIYWVQTYQNGRLCDIIALFRTGAAMIRKSSKGYKVVSRTGKSLGGSYKTKTAATKRLRQVEYFKHKGKRKK